MAHARSAYVAAVLRPCVLALVSVFGCADPDAPRPPSDAAPQPDVFTLDATVDDASPDSLSSRDTPAALDAAPDVTPEAALDVTPADAPADGPLYLRTPLGTDDPRAHRRVLVVGADGLRPDAIAASTTPNLTRLASWGVFTHAASTQLTGDTSSGPGWTSILTGVEPARHRVVANANYALRDRTWPTFLWRARNTLRLPTAASGHWPDVILSIIEADGVDMRSTGSDDAATDRMVEWIRAGTYDVHFLHLDDIDHAGHASGFSASNAGYRAALEGVDRNLGRLLDAITARPALADERWLVVFVTDHGGMGTSHGARTPECRTIPLYVAFPGMVRALPSGAVSHMDVHPTVMSFLGERIAASWALDSRPLGVRYETACADRADDDGDALVDCADPDCAEALSCRCARSDLGSRVGRRVFTGALTGAGSMRGTCGGVGPEAVATWTAPAAGTYTFDTTGSDRDFNTALYVLDGDCAGRELACNDDASGPQSAVSVPLAAGQRVVVVVDSVTATGGAFALNVEAASACPDRDLGSATGPRVATGTLGDTGGTFFASCARSGRDVLLRWRAPRAGRWRFDTLGSGYDTVLHLRGGVCAGPEIGCSDDALGGYQSSLDVTLTSGQDVTVVVSGFNGRPEGSGGLPAGGTPGYVLNVTPL